MSDTSSQSLLERKTKVSKIALHEFIYLLTQFNSCQPSAVKHIYCKCLARTCSYNSKTWLLTIPRAPHTVNRRRRLNLNVNWWEEISTNLSICCGVFSIGSLADASVMMTWSSVGNGHNTTSFPVSLTVANQPLGRNAPRYEDAACF